jgi:hypothetical protein
LTDVSYLEVANLGQKITLEKVIKWAHRAGCGPIHTQGGVRFRLKFGDDTPGLYTEEQIEAKIAEMSEGGQIA